MLRVIISAKYDGDPQALAIILEELLRQQTGEQATARVITTDVDSSVSKMAAVQAQQFVQRRPII